MLNNNANFGEIVFIKFALDKIGEVNALLCQGVYEKSEYEETIEKLKMIFE